MNDGKYEESYILNSHCYQYFPVQTSDYSLHNYRLFQRILKDYVLQIGANIYVKFYLSCGSLDCMHIFHFPVKERKEEGESIAG